MTFSVLCSRRGREELRDSLAKGPKTGNARTDGDTNVPHSSSPFPPAASKHTMTPLAEPETIWLCAWGDVPLSHRQLYRGHGQLNTAFLSMMLFPAEHGPV